MTPGALIQIFYEFAPVVAFFVAGQLLSFSGAVLVLLITTILSIIVAWLYHRHLPVMPLASGALVLVTASVTLYFNDPNAVILADTIYFWGLATAIVVGFWRRKHLLEHMFDKTFAITEAGWRKLSQRWFLVLLLAGFANEYVRIFLTPEFWIDYRFTKILLIAAFSFYQFTLARKYRIEGEANRWGLRIKASD
jgi:intracellular septation protein